MSMKHTIRSRAAALAVSLCLLFTLLTAGPAVAEDSDLVPDFTLADQYGETHSLSDYRGKVVLVNFWATWCHWCVVEMPDLEAVYQETGKNQGDFVVLGVAAPGTHDPAQDQAGITAFLKENGITYPVLMDTTGELFDAYITEGYPTTVIVRPNGSLGAVIPGAMDKETFLALLQDAQTESPAR